MAIVRSPRVSEGLRNMADGGFIGVRLGIGVRNQNKDHDKAAQAFFHSSSEASMRRVSRNCTLDDKSN
jgi:hypothetical protein